MGNGTAKRGRKEGREKERGARNWNGLLIVSGEGKKTKNAAARIGRGKCDACSATFFVALRRLDCPIRRPLPPPNPLCSPLVLLLFLSSLCHLFLPPSPPPPSHLLPPRLSKVTAIPPFPPSPLSLLPIRGRRFVHDIIRSGAMKGVRSPLQSIGKYGPIFFFAFRNDLGERHTRGEGGTQAWMGRRPNPRPSLVFCLPPPPPPNCETPR